MSDFCQTCGGFMGGHSGAECERLRRERQPLLAQVATLTHRAEVAERSCEDAKRREQEASAKMQAMAQSESNKALRHRAEAAERELAEVHRGVESVALHDARVARDAATARAEAAERALQDLHETYLYEACTPHVIAADEAEDVATLAMSTGLAECERLRESAALWRERCNKAEQKADVLTAELRRLYVAVCRGQTRSDDARAIAQAVIDEYVQTAEQCDRNDTLRADRDAARFLAAGWRRLAKHYQSCHLAGHACLRETHRQRAEEVADHRAERDWLRTERDAWKRVADERMANYVAAVRDGAALLAKLARAEGDRESAMLAGFGAAVDGAAICECSMGAHIDWTDARAALDEAIKTGLLAQTAALATYEEG